MCKLQIFIVCTLMVLLTACSKDEETTTLPDASVSFALPAGKDSLQIPLLLENNVALVLDIKAALSGRVSSDDHHVSFAIDTTKINEYRNRYGEARILPTSSYLFYKPNSVISAGSTVSDAAQLNIAQQKKLRGYTTYVLPVVIKSVDGKVEGPATSRVIYYVFKTGPASEIPRQGWTIAAYSSQNSSAVAATAAIDANNTTTYWLTSTTKQMPQYVTISLNNEYTFYGVSYYYPTILPYPGSGGYPTSIQIESSLDGTTWINRGVFAGNLVLDTSNKSTTSYMQTLNTGEVTAKFVRFTVLAAVKYSNLPIVFVSGITLAPNPMN